MDWKELLNNKMNSFHCETEEIADEFLKIANDLGLLWRSSTPLTYENHWYVYREKTCYQNNPFEDGSLYAIGYSDISHSINMNFNLINVGDLLYGRKPFKLNR